MARGIRGRFTRTTRRQSAEGTQTEVFELEPGDLERVIVAPPWLRDAGLVAWMIVGIVLVVVGMVWLLALTSTIVIPVITAMMLAAVTSPLVAKLHRRGLPRAAGAGLVLLGAIVIGVALGVLVIGGITGQSHDISAQLSSATDKLRQGLQNLGVDHSTAQGAQDDAKSSVTSIGKLFLNGLAEGVTELASFAAFASFTILSLFFLLKDGPTLRRWVERHSGVPQPVAHVIVGDMLGALRGYFVGVTIVAVFSACVVGLGALVIGVPLVPAIAIVTFLGGYVPYLGAWTAGAFAVLVALGAEGTGAAVAMAVVALLANGALQQIVQPIAFGAALGIHPLAVLILTISGGCLFGMIGLVLAAPIASAIVRITADLARARAAAEEQAGAGPAVDAPAPAT
jgi:putative heme transporter